MPRPAGRAENSRGTNSGGDDGAFTHEQRDTHDVPRANGARTKVAVGFVDFLESR